MAFMGWVALLTGCAVGPDYRRPAALTTGPLPSVFGDATITNTGEWQPAQPAANLPRGDWWKLYGDGQLDQLEKMAATNNQQIVMAFANFEQAREAVAVARAGYFPQVSATPAVTRQRTSANATPSSSQSGNSTYTSYNVTGDATWELDLWGRIRRGVEGASARWAASADDLESARLSVQAEVALDYFNLRTLEAQVASLTEASVAYQHALALTQSRKKSGVATDLDVSQAETQLKSAEAQIPSVNLQIAQTRHALAVLCGQPATIFVITPDIINATNLPIIPASIPSDWLESRPDIASAERRMAAANADIGVATSAFFPHFFLNGAGGFSSINTSTLFSSPSLLWAVGPSLQLPLFTGGLNRAQLAAAKAIYNGAVASYRQTVLAAFQDVEDQLAAQKLLEQQLDKEMAALVSAQRTLSLSVDRYKAGVDTYLDVVTSQTTVLTHEQTVIQLRGQRFATSISLLKALGAGWNTQLPAASLR